MLIGLRALHFLHQGHASTVQGIILQHRLHYIISHLCAWFGILSREAARARKTRNISLFLSFSSASENAIMYNNRQLQ